MVRQIEDHGVLGLAALFQRCENLPDTIIKKTCQAEITRHGSASCFRGEMPFIIEKTRQIADLRMIGEGLRFKVEIGVGVEIIEFLRCPKRKMRADKRYKGRPWSFGILSRANPVGGGSRDGKVIIGIAAASGATVGGKFCCRAIGRRVFAEQGCHPANAAKDMHRQDFLAESVVILAISEMQLAD